MSWERGAAMRPSPPRSQTGLRPCQRSRRRAALSPDISAAVCTTAYYCRIGICLISLYSCCERKNRW
eukprot:6214346-Pleurochrysis_carterae.AAC.1